MAAHGTLSTSSARRSAVSIQDPVISYLVTQARARLAALRRDEPEGGYSTEAVIVTALLVAGAIIAVGYIVVKIKAAAQSIQIQ